MCGEYAIALSARGVRFGHAGVAAVVSLRTQKRSAAPAVRFFVTGL